MMGQRDDQSIEGFFNQARESVPNLPGTYEVRRIGGDADTTTAILDAIRSGNKTGTVSVPAALAAAGKPVPVVNDLIILLDASEAPALLVRITDIANVRYADIDESHTALDGPRVRELGIWIAVHKPYFDLLLRPYGLACEADTIIAFERFEILFPAPGATA